MYFWMVYGVRLLIFVGVFVILGMIIFGVFIGLVVGFCGGWFDILLS